jgi:hypothetical protein
MDPEKQDVIGSATLLTGGASRVTYIWVVCNSYHDDIPENSSMFNAAELHSRYFHVFSHMFGICLE